MNIKKFGIAFSNIILYIFLEEILTFYLGKTIFFKNTILLNLYLLIAPITAGIVIILLNKEIFKQILQDFKKKYKKYIPLMFKYYFSGLILMYLMNYILALIGTNTPINEELNRNLFKVLPLYTTISTIILAPINEEVVFRGAMKKAFTNKQLYLLISSFLFGLLHVIFNGDFINLFPYAILGYFLALTYYETDNILTSIGIHAFHNALCILLLFIGGIL